MSDPFVCNRCYKQLLRFEKAKTNLRSLQEEIKKDFKKEANRTKRLRRNSFDKDGDIESINVPIEPSTALVYGPPERIAKAVVKCKLLTKHVLHIYNIIICSESCKTNTKTS